MTCGADAGFLLVVGLFERGDDLAAQARAVAGLFGLAPKRRWAAHGTEALLDGLGQARYVPLLLGRAARHVLIHELRDHVLADALDRLGHILGAHEVGALLINHAPLIVRNVVIFQQLLAGIEVVLLDAPLRALDLPRQHAAFDRLAGLHADPGHERLHAGRIAENTHQIIFQRQVEAARARVALAAGAAAQLIVDAPRFMALGADDVQSAGGQHLLMPLAPIVVNLLELASLGFSMASIWVCGLPPSTMSVPRPAMLVAMVIAPGRPASRRCAPRVRAAWR
jgi:hypothetical protein